MDPVCHSRELAVHQRVHQRGQFLYVVASSKLWATDGMCRRVAPRLFALCTYTGSTCRLWMVTRLRPVFLETGGGRAAVICLLSLERERERGREALGIPVAHVFSSCYYCSTVELLLDHRPLLLLQLVYYSSRATSLSRAS